MKILFIVLLFNIFIEQAIGVGLSFGKNIADINNDKRGWEIDLKNISLNFSQSSLTNQNLYTIYSDSNLKGNSQLSLQFFFTFNVSYYARRFVIFNSMIMEYGFTQVQQNNQSLVTNKNLDKIVFSTDYTQRVWDFDWGFENFEMGPYLKLAYQTEFVPTQGLGRRHIFNYIGGIKLFDGIYVKSLFLNAFGEHDTNPNIRLNGLGMEGGLELEYKLNNSVRWVYYMSFKKYLFNGKDSRIFPDYQFMVETKIEARLFKSLKVAPLIRYYMLKADNIDAVASNLILGVSFSFGKVLMKSKKALKDYDFSN